MVASVIAQRRVFIAAERPKMVPYIILYLIAGVVEAFSAGMLKAIVLFLAGLILSLVIYLGIIVIVSGLWVRIVSFFTHKELPLLFNSDVGNVPGAIGFILLASFVVDWMQLGKFGFVSIIVVQIIGVIGLYADKVKHSMNRSIIVLCISLILYALSIMSFQA